jgi:hypothetical protein
MRAGRGISRKEAGTRAGHAKGPGWFVNRAQKITRNRSGSPAQREDQDLQRSLRPSMRGEAFLLSGE